MIHTPLLEGIQGGSIEPNRDRLLRMQPMPRIGEPEDIAKMALYLAGDDSSFVTGAAMVVDGGYTAR